MNYKKIYCSIIDKRKLIVPDGYSENHHIIPKSLDGDDSKDNIVRLTAREHFICHYLLTKMYERDTVEWYKMVNAFLMMKCCSLSHDRYFNSRLYESLRKDFSKVQSYNQSGDGNSQYGTRWIYNNELMESKKINKTDDLPSGWNEGRRLIFDRTQLKKPKYIKKKRKNIFFGREDELKENYYNVYDENIHHTITEMNIDPIKHRRTAQRILGLKVKKY